MKKFFTILLAVFIILTSVFTASASDVCSFTLDTAEGKIYRLVEVDMTAFCDTKLAAALFSFTYDKSALEFRKASVPKGSRIVWNETADCVKISYLCEEGAETKNGSDIFTLTFKAIKSGSSFIDFTAYDCVDPDANRISLGECTSGRIDIGESSGDSDPGGGSAGNQSSASGGKSKAKVSEITENGSNGGDGKSSSAQSKRISVPTTTATDTNDKIQNDYNTVIPIVVLCISCTTAVCFIGYLAYRLIIRLKEKNNPDNK